MNTLTFATKAQITADWLRQFPGLGEYKPLQLLRRVGPLLQGVVLERASGNDAYRPTFHVHCLARAFPAVTMTLAHQLRSERSGGPDPIPLRHHESRYVECAARLEKQSPLTLTGSLELGSVMGAYRRFLARPGTHYDASILFDDMARICGWAGELERANALIAEGAEAVRGWPAEIQEQMGGVEAWRFCLTEAVSNREHLRRTADEQATLLGAGHIPVAEFHVARS